MKYLKLTMHDNDFYNEFRVIGACLERRLSDESIVFDTNNIDFEKFQKVCAELIANIHTLNSNWWYKDVNYSESPIDDLKKYCERKLSISVIDQTEISEDNDEILYVPLYTIEDRIRGITYFIM